MSLQTIAMNEDALMFIDNELTDENKLFIDASNELELLKSERPSNTTILPPLIEQALSKIMDTYNSRNRTLFNSIYHSLLNSSSQFMEDTDPRINPIRTLRQQVNLRQFELYQNIKGYYTREMVNIYLETPSKETHPIKYIIHMLGIYDMEKSRSYALLRPILNFLKYLTDTIEWYDILDQEPKSRRDHESSHSTNAHLENFCRDYTAFRDVYQRAIVPFLSDMSIFNQRFIEIQEKMSYFHDAVDKYKEKYKTEHLHRIKLFLIDVATFLRQVQSITLFPNDQESTNHIRRELLCKNIAFTIECMCGLYNPIEYLFEQITPIMLKNY